MDYWYHLETLLHLNIYEFTKCGTLKNKNRIKNPILNEDEKCLGVMNHIVGGSDRVTECRM